MTEKAWKKIVDDEEERAKKKKKEGDATEKHPEGAENAVGELFAECNMHHYKEHCAVFSNRINYSKRAQFRSFFYRFPVRARCEE